ncbi:hypothetical protein BRC81_15525 [Halobacteriales archaeon QS_1_68_20]|nr:MAG: hypothetical protein BRC81_15525 [Halobacteriales archaeon QS_1_68_20]
MIEDTESRLGRVVGDSEPTGARERIEGVARERLDERAETVREELERRTDETKMELGERLFDLGEEYFPQVAAQRRRQLVSAGFLVGLAAGFLARHLMD